MTKRAKQGLLAITPPCPPGLAVAGITNRSRCFLWQSWDGSHSKDGSRDSGKRSLSAPRGALASPPLRHQQPTVRSVGASLVKPPPAGWGSGMGWGHTHPAERIQGYPNPPFDSQMRRPDKASGQGGGSSGLPVSHNNCPQDGVTVSSQVRTARLRVVKKGAHGDQPGSGRARHGARTAP